LNVHWLFLKGECVLTLWERQLIEPNYVMGTDPYNHIWLKIIFGDYLNVFMVFMTLAMAFNTGYVVMRYFDNAYLKIALLLLIFSGTFYYNLSRFN
jgi:hypothetical protein